MRIKSGDDNFKQWPVKLSFSITIFLNNNFKEDMVWLPIKELTIYQSSNEEDVCLF